MKKNQAATAPLPDAAPPPVEESPQVDAAAAGAPNADLDALAGEAERLEHGDQPQGDQPRQEEARTGQHQISTARMVQGALLGAGGLLATRCPAAKLVYTEDRCMMVGEALAPVLDRWGVNASNSVFMQYCVAIGALVLLGKDTVDVLRATTHEHQAPAGSPAGKSPP